jgi:D-alanine-D-alanine ligase
VKILVLAGGDSNERAVSLNSGAAICQALMRLGHEVKALDPGTGQPLVDNQGRLLIDGGRAPYEMASVKTPEPGALVTAMASDYSDVEVVFLALHGGRGENGSIQNLLDLAGRKYTGSGMTASAVSMDKALTKGLMVSVGIPTPPWEIFRLGDDFDPDKMATHIAQRLSPPLIIKPNDGGSTIGLVKVNSQIEVAEALRECARHTREILVEAYIPGRELTVTVFDGRAYPVVEIKPKSGLYDYEAKYTKGKSEYIAPAEIDPAIAALLQSAAVQLFNVIGCVGLTRVDFILNEHADFFCLEINTLPGMTNLSLAPMAMKCEGIDFDHLVAMMIESALKH